MVCPPTVDLVSDDRSKRMRFGWASIVMALLGWPVVPEVYAIVESEVGAGPGA
jgi:hypothetical protein